MLSRPRSRLSTEPTLVDCTGDADRTPQQASVLAFVVALFLQGCGGLGDSYVVQVDPRFTQDEQATIVAALGSWEAAVPVHFVAEIEPCSGVHGGTICVHASDSATIAAMQSEPDGTGVGLTHREKSWGHAVDGGEIYIDVATVEAILRRGLPAHRRSRDWACDAAGSQRARQPHGRVGDGGRSDADVRGRRAVVGGARSDRARLSSVRQ